MAWEAQAGHLGGKLGLEGRAALDREPSGFQAQDSGRPVDPDSAVLLGLHILISK